jgi:hypothetical protein
MLKGYLKATGKCPNIMDKLGKCSYWLGVMKNPENEAISQ